MENRISIAMKKILTLFLVFYGYAVVRYHFGKQLDISNFLFVFNKAIAWSSAAFLGFSLLQMPKNYPSRKVFGLSAFGFGLTHIILTIILGIQTHYKELFIQGSLTEKGFLVVITGVLSITLMIFPFVATLFPSKFPKRWFHYGKWALLVNLLHPLIIGVGNWWTPLKWPYYLPPITLLIVLMNGVLFSIYWNKKRRVN
jgi:hypothetical protein